jgi:hypothetical protein
MTNREKTIVGMAVLAVVAYVGIEFWPSPKSAPVHQASGLEGINVFISKIADATKSGPTEVHAEIIRKAEAGWKQSPFLKIQKPQAPAPPEARVDRTPARPKPNLKFTGYIDMGDRRLAIINGLEYESGDRLDPGGFTIKSILPNKVVMVYTQGEGQPIELPLQESE